jgi:hypothetical protein
MASVGQKQHVPGGHGADMLFTRIIDAAIFQLAVYQMLGARRLLVAAKKLGRACHSIGEQIRKGKIGGAKLVIPYIHKSSRILQYFLLFL